MTDFYMEYWALSLSMEGKAECQGEFCELGASHLTEERVEGNAARGPPAEDEVGDGP